MIITLAVLVKGKERQKLIYGFFLILFFGILLFFFTSYDQGGRSARLVRAVVARFSTLQNSSTYDQGSSLRWRDFEYQYALPQIASHPVLGLGMGAMYRPLVQGRDHEYYDGRTYIHNGHVWIILKSGILGYLSWLYLSLAFLYRGFKYWQLINEPWMKAIVLGFTLSFLAVFIGSLFEPMVMEANWTSLLGIMMGTNEVIFIMNSQEHS
jgi:O-antigen ligase